MKYLLGSRAVQQQRLRYLRQPARHQANTLATPDLLSQHFVYHAEYSLIHARTVARLTWSIILEVINLCRSSWMDTSNGTSGTNTENRDMSKNTPYCQITKPHTRLSALHSSSSAVKKICDSPDERDMRRRGVGIDGMGFHVFLLFCLYTPDSLAQ